MPTLFDPIQRGAIPAPNRILMAPLNRVRMWIGMGSRGRSAPYRIVNATSDGVSHQRLFPAIFQRLLRSKPSDLN